MPHLKETTRKHIQCGTWETRRMRKHTIKRKEGQWRVKSVRKKVLEVGHCSRKENKHDIRQWFRRVQLWEGCVGLRRWSSAYPSVSAGTQVTLVGHWIFPPPCWLRSGTSPENSHFLVPSVLSPVWISWVPTRSIIQKKFQLFSNTLQAPWEQGLSPPLLQIHTQQ